jgi:hypothetical protein
MKIVIHLFSPLRPNLLTYCANYSLILRDRSFAAHNNKQYTSVFTKLHAFSETRNCNGSRQLGEAHNVTHCRSVRTGSCTASSLANWNRLCVQVTSWGGEYCCPADHLLTEEGKNSSCRNVGLCKECQKKRWPGNRAVIVLWRNIDRTVRMTWQLTVHKTNQPITQPTILLSPCWVADSYSARWKFLALYGTPEFITLVTEACFFHHCWASCIRSMRCDDIYIYI